MKQRRRAVWSLISGLVIALPVLYVATFGPAMWLVQTDEAFRRPIAVVYFPLGRMADDIESPFHTPLAWWVGLCAEPTIVLMSSTVVHGFEVPIGPNDEWGTAILVTEKRQRRP